MTPRRSAPAYRPPPTETVHARALTAIEKIDAVWSASVDIREAVRRLGEVSTTLDMVRAERDRIAADRDRLDLEVRRLSALDSTTSTTTLHFKVKRYRSEVNRLALLVKSLGGNPGRDGLL